MDKKSENKKHHEMTNIAPEEQEFTVSKLSLFQRGLAIFLTVLLSFSLLMSEISRFKEKGHLVLIDNYTPVYILLILFLLTTVLKALFSVRQVIVNKEGLEISNFINKEKKDWKELNCLNAPNNLAFAWLRTNGCFYLFVKKEFIDYQSLETYISQHLNIKR